MGKFKGCVQAMVARAEAGGQASMLVVETLSRRPKRQTQCCTHTTTSATHVHNRHCKPPRADLACKHVIVDVLGAPGVCSRARAGVIGWWLASSRQTPVYGQKHCSATRSSIHLHRSPARHNQRHPSLPQHPLSQPPTRVHVGPHIIGVWKV